MLFYTVAPPPMGLYFMLNSVVYYQGDTVLITDIGTQPSDRSEDGSTLVCVTTNVNSDCCRTKDNPSNNLHGGAVGNWYYPDGTMVPRPSANSIALIRVGGLHHVRLARLDTTLSAPLGIYRCEVPDGVNGKVVIASINISNISPEG